MTVTMVAGKREIKDAEKEMRDVERRDKGCWKGDERCGGRDMGCWKGDERFGGKNTDIGW